MHPRPVALITGANKGIGRAIAADLARHGFTVLVGSRDLAAGQEAASFIGDAAQAIQLDVTDAASIAAAAERIGKDLGRLDVLVNNAAISHAGKLGRPLAEVARSGLAGVVPLDEVRAVFETNVFGVLAVTQAMLPLLREAPAARIVNVSSGVGSLTRVSDPANAYRSMFGLYSFSKTALNGVTVALALDLENTAIKVNAACPGFTATDLNNFEGTQSVEEAAREPVRLALLGADGPTGGYSSASGPLAW